MRIDQAQELIEAGEKLDVKVALTTVKGDFAVNIRDGQFTDFLRAARCLQHIQSTELPESFHGLVG